MENNNLIPDVALQIVPEVDDIMDVQVTNQLVLVKPFIVETIKTANGIILDGGADLDKMKSAMLQRGIVVNAGIKCNEVKIGMTVFYFKSNFQGMIRQENELYFLLNEYDIRMFLK